MASVSRAADRTDRNPRLDGVRGLAVLLVMLYHTTHYGGAQSAGAVALTFVPAMGWSGVDLFFVLSGFLITGILLRAKPHGSYFGAFYARRVLRIFPLYYAFIAFFFLVVPHIEIFSYVDFFWFPEAERETIWYWTYLSNIQVALRGIWQHQILAITWSLAIEEHFYLFWPAVVWWVDERWLPWVCCGMVACALALRAGLLVAGADPLVPYVLTPCRLDPLAVGAWLAVMARRPGGLDRFSRWAGPACLSALTAFGALYAWVRFATGSSVAPLVTYEQRQIAILGFVHEPWIQTLGFTLLAMAYGALVVWVITARGGALRARFFEFRPLCSLGKYSYSMYLVHVFVALLVLGLFAPAAHPERFVLSQLLFWAVSISVTYLVARFTWLAVEEPVLSLKSRFPYPGAREAS